jgi:cytochrome oxidase Cu insertion factor (SCO1/SenC/PrrC family)
LDGAGPRRVCGTAAGATIRLTTALIAGLVLAGCVQALPPKPKFLTIAAHAPAAWAAPHRAAVEAPAEIQAIRVSSLDVRPGADWDGDVVASTNTASLEIGTNLFDFSAPRTQPGRFHFNFHVIDMPALFVRPYVLYVKARNTAGQVTELDLPFRISGRTPVSAYNADARASEALAAPPLVDMNGRAVDLDHGVTVLSFIYTRCPDPRMCPLVTAKFAQMSRLLAGTPVHLLEVTLDPDYDTPAVLRAYGHAAGADGDRWTLATGQPAALAAFAEHAGLYVDRPRPGVILHTDAVLIARDGTLERNYGGNDWTAAGVAAEARSIATLPGDPIARFALRLFGGVVEVCGGAVARGFTPLGMLTILLGLAAVAAATLLYAGRHRIRTRFARR